MGEFLIFQLCAQLGAMGGFAGHERRGSLTWPGRSAVIGLMGAAQGIRRDGDFAGLEQLHISVALFETGDVLRDYHTVETVPSAAAKAPQSRPEALRTAGRRSNTTITLRDYRMGVLYGVAVQGEGLAPLAEALRRPVFPLYLGRKSCTLSAPLHPQVVTAGNAAAALAHLRVPRWHAGTVSDRLARDARPEDQMVEQRHDIATDRARWHFAPRRVVLDPVQIIPQVAQRGTV